MLYFKHSRATLKIWERVQKYKRGNETVKRVALYPAEYKLFYDALMLDDKEKNKYLSEMPWSELGVIIYKHKI